MPNYQPITYRSLFVSDLHMGKWSGRSGGNPSITPLLHFIKDKHFEHIYLIGDIFDFWEMIVTLKWDKNYNLFLQKILRFSRKGAKVVYLLGNHDDCLAPLKGLDFGGITFEMEAVHTTAQDKTFWVTHGHFQDPLDRISRVLRKITYKMVACFPFLSRKIAWLGFKTINLWVNLGQMTNRRTKDQEALLYRDRCIRKVNRKGYDGIICGHFHSPEITTMKKGKIYINAGDSCSHFTVVTENSKGNFKLHKL